MIKKCLILIIFLSCKSGWCQSELELIIFDYYRSQKSIFQLPLFPFNENFTIREVNAAGFNHTGYPVTLYSNPAALSALNGAMLYLETGYRPEFNLVNGKSLPVFIVPQVASGAISMGSFTVGIGYHCTYYLKNEIDLTSLVDGNNKDILMSQQRKIDTFTLASAYNIGNRFSIGAAVVYLNDILESKANGVEVLNSRVNGLNFAVGGLLRVIKGINLGMNFVRKSDLTNQEKVFDLLPIEFKHLLPARFRVGIGIFLLPNWQFLFDIERVYWSNIPVLFNSNNNRFQYNIGIIKKFKPLIIRICFYTRSHSVSNKLDQNFLIFSFEKQIKGLNFNISFHDSYLLTKYDEYLLDRYPLNSAQLRYFSFGLFYNIN